MTLTALGRVNQPAPGTPVPLSTNENLLVAKLFVQMIPGLTGKAYLGVPGMTKSNLNGVARVLWPNPNGGIADQFFVETDDGDNRISLSQIVIDLDVAGEGVLVSYWIA